MWELLAGLVFLVLILISLHGPPWRLALVLLTMGVSPFWGWRAPVLVPIACFVSFASLFWLRETLRPTRPQSVWRRCGAAFMGLLSILTTVLIWQALFAYVFQS